MADDAAQPADDPEALPETLGDAEVHPAAVDESTDRIGDIIILGVLAFIAGWFQIGLIVALLKGGLNLFTGIFIPANIGLFWLIYVLVSDLYPDRPRGKTIALTFAAEAIALAAIMGPIALVAYLGTQFG